VENQKTIFKKIIDKEIPTDLLHEDDLCLAFNDISPQAPVHVLIIPRKEIQSLAHLEKEDAEILGHMMLVIKGLAEKMGLENGYRVIANTGQDGGQTVHHLHFHLLGKRPLKWPPG